MRVYRWRMKAPGLAFDEQEGNLWASCTMRKAHTCTVCDTPISKGREAFRPLTEHGRTMRFERAHVTCVHRENVDWTARGDSRPRRHE